MTDPRNLRRVFDILNGEGCILGLKKDLSGNLYLSSYLKDGSGNVFYSVSEQQLKDFAQSKITIQEMYLTSNEFMVQVRFRNEVKTYLKEEFQDNLFYGSDYYKDISESLKSKEFERLYGS